MAKIEVADKKISELLSQFYIIPSFQRLYVWERKNVSQLFNDLLQHFEEVQSDPTLENYFLGSFICYQTEGRSEAEVIDGQQRLTTLIILLAAIRDHLRQSDLEFPGYAKKMLVDEDADPKTGLPIDKKRLAVHYADGNRFISSLLAGRLPDKSFSDGESFHRLYDAYENLKLLVGTHLDDDSVYRFLGFLKEKVSVIFLSTQSFSTCFRLFETINARGVSLESTDLVKNILFSKAKDGEVAELDAIWNSAIQVFDGRMKDFMAFFKDYGLSQTPQQELKDDELIELYRKEKNALTSAKDMAEKATWFQRIADSRDLSNQKCDALERLTYVGGRSFRIHLSILLAIATKDPLHFDRVVDILERFIVISKVVKIPTQTMRNIISGWRVQLIKASDDTLEDVLASISADLSKYKTDFSSALNSQTISVIDPKVRRYLLCRIYSDFEQSAYGAGHFTFNALLKSKQYEEEHCLPQTFKEAAAEAADISRDEYDEWIWRFGNLLLLEKSNNATSGQLPYPDKVENYKNSSFVINRSLGKAQFPGSQNQIARATAILKQYDIWTKSVILERSKLYTTHLITSMGL